MKRLVLKSLIISTVLMLSFSFRVSAQEWTFMERLNSVSFRAGAYVPTDDLDEFDTGFHVDAMFTRYLSRNLAIEAGVGLYYTEETYSGVSSGMGSYTETDSISTTPVVFNFKVIAPFQGGEFYLGAGVGLYFAYAEADVTSTGWGSFTFEDSDVVVGGQFKAGIIFNIDKTLFLGIEGTYMITDTAEFTEEVFGVPISIETDLNGYTVNGVFGFRF